MTSIKADYTGGRYGNILFQYGNAVLVSAITGHRLLDSGRSPRVQALVDDNIFNSIEHIHSFHDQFKGDQIISLPTSCYDNKDESIIELPAGYYQLPDRVQAYIKYKHILFREISCIDGLFVHVRLGDIYEGHFPKVFMCGIDYYRHALDRCGHVTGGRYISSDTPDAPIIKTLCEEYNLQLYSEPDAGTTIKFAAQFHNKVLSMGTFSWWIGFLGCQENIIHPVQIHGKIHRFSGEIYDDDLGWTYIQ